LIKNLKFPVCCTPKRNLTFTEAPGASGVASVIVSIERLLLYPPPDGCDGGLSSVVPSIFTAHGVAAEPGSARQVAGSLMPFTTVADDVRLRRSAIPDGAKKVV